ncbi:hypothetical protein [Paenibacillus lemnae]|uniref:Uncharacterized protein n=1 Tax=Paenibacillus lemnae TaxID=1330551 RepID=A0A848M9F9_PAELE|nr:hypothetical protein [Paenibacillus lemnae]NMO97246.1 hypothetical protein [Paenibacillus lemnae]
MDHLSDKELQRLEDELKGPLTTAVRQPPSTQETAFLISSLQDEFDLLKAGAAPAKLDFNPQVDPPSLKQLLLNQFRLNQKMILLASSAVFIMLVLLIDPRYPMDQLGGIPGGIFPLITPVLLMMSMLFSSRTWDRGMRAVETITPYPPSLVLYSRLLSVTVIIMSLGMISTLVLGIRSTYTEGSYFLMGPFLLEWMSVLLLTGGAAMYMMFKKGIISAMCAAVLAYVVWIFFQGELQYQQLPLVMKMSIDTVVLVVGALLVITAYAQSLKNRPASRETRS